jgi:hypothetical protein
MRIEEQAISLLSLIVLVYCIHGNFRQEKFFTNFATCSEKIYSTKNFCMHYKGSWALAKFYPPKIFMYIFVVHGIE